MLRMCISDEWLKITDSRIKGRKYKKVFSV